MIWERAVAENAWEIEPGLYRVLLPLPFAVPFVNAYVVASQGEFLLVDCGANWLPSLRALGRALKAIGVPPRGLTALLLTHTHPDHSDGAAPVRERWGGRVLLNPDEHPRERVAPETFLSWLEDNGVDEAILTKARVPSRDHPSGLPEQIEPLDLHQVLRVGEFAFELIAVPGHSPGQVMLREASRGWLLTADHVLPVQASNVWHFPGTDGDPFGDYLAALERTLDLDARLILPSHGLPFRGGLREATLGMIDYHRRMADRVREALRAGPRKGWEMVKILSGEAPSDLSGVRFSLAEVTAVLTHLEKRGEARRRPDRRWEWIVRGVSGG